MKRTGQQIQASLCLAVRWAAGGTVRLTTTTTTASSSLAHAATTVELSRQTATRQSAQYSPNRPIN